MLVLPGMDEFVSDDVFRWVEACIVDDVFTHSYNDVFAAGGADTVATLGPSSGFEYNLS